MKEKVLEALKALGFELEESERNCYEFQYENLYLLYLYNENDEDFMSIACPCSIKKEEIGELAYYQLMDKVNSTMKYIKANDMNDRIWLFYERDICNEEDLEETLNRIILSLEAGFNFLHKKLRALSENVDTECSASEITDDTDNEDTKE